MIPTPLQPIRFDTLDETCCEVLDYRYEIQADDEVVLQVIVGACPDATEEITNTEINTAPWVRKTAQGGVLTPSGTLFTDFTVEQPVTMVEGTWYEIKLTIQYPNSINTVGVIRQNIIGVEGFQDTIETIAATGEYTFFGRWGAGTDILIRRTDTSFEPDEDNGFMPTRVSGISIKEVVAPTLEAISPGGVVFDTFAIFDLQYPYVNINYLASIGARDAGCFRIRITQGCTPEQVLTTETIYIVPDNPCSVRVLGCGHNTFFKGDFSPPLRLPARLVDDGPVGEREIARNSIGTHRLTYGHVHYSYLLEVERVPEHIRHFLYLLPYFETVAMQKNYGPTSLYFALEDAEKEDYAEGDDNLASVSIRFVKKTQNLTATYVGICLPSFPPYVLGERSTNTAITDETQTTLIKA